MTACGYSLAELIATMGGLLIGVCLVGVVLGWAMTGLIRRPVLPATTKELERQRIADDLLAEVERRNEYYGLDNWKMREVVDFVLDRKERR